MHVRTCNGMLCSHKRGAKQQDERTVRTLRQVKYVRQRQTLHDDLTDLKKSLTEKEIRFVVTRGRGQINKGWGCNVQRDDYS